MTTFSADARFGHSGVQFLLDNAVAGNESMTIAEFLNSFDDHIEEGTSEKRIETIIGRENLLAGISDQPTSASEDVTLRQAVERDDPLPAGSVIHPIQGITDDTDIVTGVRSLTAYGENINIREKKPGDAAEGEKKIRLTYSEVITDFLGSVEGWDIDLEILHGMYRNRRVEVKSIQNFLNRYHTRQPELNLDEGSLYFELYNQARSGSSYGSLYHMLYPDRCSREGCLIKILDPELIGAERSTLPVPARRTSYLEPDYLVFLLYITRNDPHPFAAVSFEWKSLKEKLSSLRDDIWPKWRIPKYDAVSREQWVVNNCWHVPMTELVDVARITMIEPIDGEKVIKLAGENGWDIGRMRKRYRFLRNNKQTTITVLSQ